MIRIMHLTIVVHCVCVFAYLELCPTPNIYFVAKFEAVQDINSTLVDMNSVSC